MITVRDNNDTLEKKNDFTVRDNIDTLQKNDNST